MIRVYIKRLTVWSL